MKRKLELNQCTKCKRTYDLKVVNATPDICSHCNEKYKNEFRKRRFKKVIIKKMKMISLVII